jgi:translation initiation factor 2 subunit 1
VEVLENASYVELLEYNRIKGMITPNEMTKPIRGGVLKALKYRQQMVVRVLRVDEDQGYIDLSKKRVQKDEVRLFHKLCTI